MSADARPPAGIPDRARGRHRGPMLIVAMAAVAAVAALSAGAPPDEPTSRRHATGTRPSAAVVAQRKRWDAVVRSCPALSALSGRSVTAITGADASTQVASIAAFVEADRGLRFPAPPAVSFVTPSSLQNETGWIGDVMLTVFDGMEQLSVQALQRALNQRGSGGLGVLGYYDPGTKALVVGTPGFTSIDPLTQAVVAHELEHAVVFQSLEPREPAAPNRFSAYETAVAFQSLVEGDARLTEYRYTLQKLTTAQVDSFVEDDRVVAARRASKDIPDLAILEGYFPYDVGRSFVCSRWVSGGYAAVDAAYRDPPTTTAQILFPDRYVAHEQPVDAPASHTPAGWRSSALTFGARDLYMLLLAPRGDSKNRLPDARELVAGWAGGRVDIMTSRGETAIGVSLVQHAAAPNLCDTMRRWMRAAFPDGRTTPWLPGDAYRTPKGRVALVRCNGSNVRLAFAPNAATATEIAG